MDASRAVELALLAAATIVLVLFFLPFLSAILTAILLAYLLGVPHRWLAQYVGERLAAVAVILSGLVVLVLPFLLLLNVVLAGLDELQATIQENLDTINEMGLDGLLGALFGGDQPIQVPTAESIRDVDIGAVVPIVLDTVGGISSAFVVLSVIVFLTYYLLSAGDRLLGWLGTVFPVASDVQSELYSRADNLMYAVIVGQFAIAVVTGLLTGLGLFLTGFDDVIFWTVLCLFLALVPLIGTMIVWVPAAGYLFLAGDVVPGALLFAYGAVVIGAADNVLRPFVGASQANLSPAIFILGVFSGLTVLGPIGVFFGPIAIGMAKIVYETVLESPDVRGAPAQDGGG